MTHTVHFPSTLRGTIALPSSKSLSNRALLISALCGGDSGVEHVSACDDTFVMWRALHDRPHEVDIMAAGTAMRFLTAYFSVCNGEEHILTGTQRMLERPIGVLVDALRSIGADISYQGEEGCPPLLVRGRRLSGGRLSLPANVSSQYISALLLVAPMMHEGLVLELQGEIMSRPYIDMTLSLMRSFGADAAWTRCDTVEVRPRRYAGNLIYSVESDWSAASYWYEMVALTPDAEARIVLPLLFKESLQGDSEVWHIFEKMGVQTVFNEAAGHVVLTKKHAAECLSPDEALELNLSSQPDLAQTLVVTCAMLRRPFRFTGLRSLRIKETDRIAALQEGLAHFGITLGVVGDDELYMRDYPVGAPSYDGQPIATHADHRMAMAFAPAALVCEGVQIADPGVVSKSYPHFWDDLAKL